MSDKKYVAEIFARVAQQQIGNDVRYRLGDEENAARMNRDSGARIPVRRQTDIFC